MWTLFYYETGNKHPAYTITFSNINSLNYYTFYYELKSMQYSIKQGKFQLPSMGFNRNFTCGVLDSTSRILYLGTGGGEISIFTIDNLLYKSSFNVINNGVMGLVQNEDPNGEYFIIIGGGDGRIKKMTREGSINNSTIKHSLTHEIQLNGKVTSMSPTSDKKEIVVSTSTGYIYRVLVNDLTYTLHSVGHTSPVNDICFNNRFNDRCYTVDDNGNTFIWDLNDYNLLSFIPPNSLTEKAKSVSIGDDGKII